MLDMQEIIMTTLSGANASKAAEYVILAMLSMAGRLFDVYHHQRDAVWMTDEEVNSLEIRELRGSTVGIVGYGSIGRETARLLHSFGMTILAAKRDVKAPHDSGYIPPGRGDPQGDYFHRLYPIQALRSMLKECDYVVITVPLTPETRNLIGVEEMGVMKPSAYLINVSRGAVVDEEALINALNHSQIAGAALDVSAIEPLPSENPLWQMPNVLISPHIADQSISYDVHSVELFLENCKRYLSAEPLLNEFDQKIGY